MRGNIIFSVLVLYLNLDQHDADPASSSTLQLKILAKQMKNGRQSGD